MVILYYHFNLNIQTSMSTTIAPLRAFEEWEAQCSLSDKELECIALLKELSAELPIPVEVLMNMMIAAGTNQSGSVMTLVI